MLDCRLSRGFTLSHDMGPSSSVADEGSRCAGKGAVAGPASVGNVHEAFPRRRSSYDTSCEQAVEAVAEAVQRHGVGTLVVDPVLVATSGDSLAASDVVHALIDRCALSGLCNARLRITARDSSSLSATAAALGSKEDSAPFL